MNMYQQKLSIRRIIKYFLIINVVLVGLSIIILSYIEMYTINSEKKWLQEEELKIVQSQATILGDEIESIIADLVLLERNFEVSIQKTSDFDEIIFQWELLANTKRIYDQIRYIDVTGHERIRINYENQKAYTVEKNVLQNRETRYYFRETIKLNDGEIYISPFDLNIENDEIEIPYKPMIRFSTPLYNGQGELQGIVIVNYLASNLLTKFEALETYSNGRMYLVNSEGYYLDSGDKDKDFGFMFNKKEDFSFKSDFSNFWNILVSNQYAGITENGMFTGLKFDMSDKVNPLDKGKIFLAEKNWYIISHIGYENENYYIVDLNNIEVVKSILSHNYIFLGFLSIISLLISFLICERRKSFHQVKYLSEYDDMTGVLNRRSGINDLTELLRTVNLQEESIVIYFIDIDGLKTVNDVLGHDYGDELILNVVTIIKKKIRESDLFARIGGDEFLLVGHNIKTGMKNEIWTRIQEEINGVNESEKWPYIISLSHGAIEVTNDNNKDIDELIKRADIAMYRDKKKRRETLDVLRK